MNSLQNRNSPSFKRKVKIITAGAVTVTVVGVLLLTAGIILNVKFPQFYDVSVVLLTVGSVFVITVMPLTWIFRYMLTRVTLEEKLERLNNPSVEYYAAAKVPKMRFNFKENAVREEFGKIAEKYDLTADITVRRCEILPFGSDCSPKMEYIIYMYDGKKHYNYGRKHHNYFHVYIQQDYIEFSAPAVCGDVFLLLDDIARTNRFEILDESYVSEIVFDKLSDSEIFNIIERLVYVLYGAVGLKAEKREIDLYRKYYTAYEYTFYLDAPDYYGYTETTEIGNFKFILNKENGGTVNV